MSNLSNQDIYVNVSLTNTNDVGVLPAKFLEERAQPLLKNPSEYKMSVVRFDIPSTAIKKFSYQNDFIITLVHPASGLQSQQTMVLIPSDVGTTLDDDPLGVWSFNQITQSINVTYQTAFNDLVAQYEAINGPGSWVTDPGNRPQSPPIMYYNEVDKLFSVYCPTDMEDSNADRVELWWNYEFHRLFITFYVEFYGIGIPTNLDIRVKIYDQLKNSETVNTINYYVMTQEYETTTLWFDTYKIVIVSHSMPIRREYIAAISNQLDISGNTVQLGVLADFDYSFDTANISRIRYIPSAEFRWIDLLTTTPLKKLDIEIFVENTQGTLRPVILQPGQTFNCKLLFRRKSREEIDAMESHPGH